MHALVPRLLVPADEGGFDASVGERSIEGRNEGICELFSALRVGRKVGAEVSGPPSLRT